VEGVLLGFILRENKFLCTDKTVLSVVVGGIATNIINTLVQFKNALFDFCSSVDKGKGLVSSTHKLSFK